MYPRELHQDHRHVKTYLRLRVTYDTFGTVLCNTWLSLLTGTDIHLTTTLKFAVRPTQSHPSFGTPRSSSSFPIRRRRWPLPHLAGLAIRWLPGSPLDPATTTTTTASSLWTTAWSGTGRTPTSLRGMRRRRRRSRGRRTRRRGRPSALSRIPMPPDYEPIVLTKRFRRVDSKVKKANEMLVAHYNDMRNCRNSYIEAAVSLSGRDKSQRLKELAAEFKVLKSKTADHVAAVENLNGHPVPMRDNLEKLPPVEQFTKGRPNAKKR